MNQTKSAKPMETAVIHKTHNEVRVLLFDVESSPNIGYTWGKFEQDVIEFIQERQIICFSWKWLGEKKIHSRAIWMLPGYKKNPKSNYQLIRELHDLFGKADVVVGHNVDDFDDRMSNTDFLKHNLPPPPPHRTVDTLKFARHKFRFNSNKLDDLGAFLKLGRKVKHPGFELWKKCLEGDRKSQALMVRYNCGDVELLEKIYLKMRPWMANHPSLNAFDGRPACPVCRSKNVIREGWRITINGKKPRFHCGDCGKWCIGQVIRREWRFK